MKSFRIQSENLTFSWLVSIMPKKQNKVKDRRNIYTK